MKTIRSLLVCAALASLLTTSFAADPNSAAGPVVPLPPYRVNEFMSYFGFAWKAVIKEDKIQRVRFSRIDRDSLASRAGLMPDDVLLTIDGQKVNGMTVEDLQKAFYRPVKPGSTVLWKFTIERGALLNRQHDITLQLHTAADQESTPAAAEPAKNG